MSTLPGVASETVLVVEVSCAECGCTPRPDKHTAFIEMERWLGDGKRNYVPTAEERARPPFYLCAKCWIEGLHPNVAKRIVEPAGAA